MYHVATFRHETAAERVAGRMELKRIRTGLRGDHLASGDTVYNLFVSDRQAEVASRILPDLMSDMDEHQEVMECPICNSREVHPADTGEGIFPFEPRFRLQQTSGDPLKLTCQNCGHTWS